MIMNFKLLKCMDTTEKIRKDTTMADKLMFIPNDETQNYQFCRLQCAKRLVSQLN